MVLGGTHHGEVVEVGAGRGVVVVAGVVAHHGFWVVVLVHQGSAVVVGGLVVHQGSAVVVGALVHHGLAVVVGALVHHGLAVVAAGAEGFLVVHQGMLVCEGG